MTPERVILNWEQAYREAHGKRNAPRVTYRGGWFRIDGLMGAKRQAEIDEMTANLRALIPPSGQVVIREDT